jgi:hypothetical protein
MRLDEVSYRTIFIIFILISLCLYGIGCSSSNNTNDSGNQNPIDPNPSSGNTVSYSNDIQPIFKDNCSAANCHGANAPSGLRLTSYANLVKGGVSGKPFIAGDSANSLIIKRLEGVIGPRMPTGAAPLLADQIKAIKNWIDAGGKDN